MSLDFFEQDDMDMTYDAYVVSTEEFSAEIPDVKMTDIGYVKNVLKPRLEGQHPYFRLYLEIRDREPGVVILHGIRTNLESSRRVIIVLTENFLKVMSLCHSFSLCTFLK